MGRCSLLPATVVAAILVVAGCRADDGPSREEGLKLFSQAFANLLEQKSFAATQKTSVNTSGVEVELELKMFIEPPDRAYAITTQSGQTAEVVILAQRVYLRQGDGPWATTSLQSLGFDVASLYEPFDLAAFASEVEVLSDLEEDGKRLAHLRARLDGNKFGDAIGEFFQANSPGSAIADAEWEEMKIEYFIDRESVLPQRGTLSFKYSESGTSTDARTDFSYSAFNEPVVYPPDLPPPMPPDPDAPQPCAKPDGCLASSTGFYEAYDDPRACAGEGKRVCLVPIGEVPKDLVDHLVEYYAQEYGLALHVLPPIALAGGQHPTRPGQRETWRLRASFSKFYPDYDSDPDVALIGLTALDVFYPDRPEWNWVFGSTFSFDGLRPQQAIVSIFRMDPENWGQPEDDALRNRRARRMMNKYIALIHYGLDESLDPRSVLYGGIASVADLDNIDERIPLKLN